MKKIKSGSGVRRRRPQGAIDQPQTAREFNLPHTSQFSPFLLYSLIFNQGVEYYIGIKNKFRAIGWCELWFWEPILMGARAQDLLRFFLKNPKGVQFL
jgi:hypothetical protein